MSSMTQILKLDPYKMHVPVPMAVLQVTNVDYLVKDVSSNSNGAIPQDFIIEPNISYLSECNTLLFAISFLELKCPLQ